jgi:molybdenum cofactor cytidylyltransferase
VIILASGRGERFAQSGGRVPKLQALLCGKPVLQHTLDAVKASGLAWHVESAAHPGMGDSIAAAVAATADAAGWLILPADLPLVRMETLQTIAQHLCQSEVVLPTYQQLRGHPVGFGRACMQDLLALSGAHGAMSIVRRHACMEIPVDDVGIVTDIDTVQDLQHAQALCESLRP